MATVIDSLIVKLGLDATEFKRGEKQVDQGLEQTRKRADRTGKQIQQSGQQAAEFFNQMRGAALRFFAVLTIGQGLSNFTRTIVQTGAQLDRMAKNFGTSTDRLSRWTAAVKINGGTAEGFLGTMQGLSSALTELKLTGTTGILPYLQALGVSVADATGKARPLEDILGDIGDKLNAMPNREDAFNIGRNLGIDDATINLLMKGRGEVEKLLAAQKGYSEEDARRAREAAERWEQVKINIERTTQEIIIKALPTLERLAQTMEKFAAITVPFLSKAVELFGELDEATGGWATNLALALAALRLITGPGIVAGVGKLAGGLARAGAVGAAGVGGYAAGSYISKNYIEGTELSNTIGRSIAQVLAAFGNDEARQALINNGDMAAPAAAPKTKGSSGVRAIRNNNPGNLEFRGQAGAVPEDGSGRFAKFGSSAEGVAALIKQLQRYGSRGLDTLEEIINTYAPSSENNTQAYISALSKRLGVSGSDQLNLSDANTLAALVRGISTHEAGRDYLSNQDIMSGLQMAGVRGGGSSGNSYTIGEVKVYTQATDANGIARDMNQAIIRQADTGMR